MGYDCDQAPISDEHGVNVTPAKIQVSCFEHQIHGSVSIISWLTG